MEDEGAVHAGREVADAWGVRRAWSSPHEVSMPHSLIQIVVGLLALVLLVSPIVLANKVDLNRGEPDERDVL
jgi:hypothetical protein